MKHLIILCVVVLTACRSFSQIGKLIENDFLQMKKTTIGIGTVINDTLIFQGKKTAIKKFIVIGSGLVTYVKYDTSLITNVVTAGHVVRFFLEHKLKSIFLRPSWADTIKTTEYFGVEVPVVNKNNTPNTFLYPNSHVDLGCILMPDYYFDKTFISKAEKDKLTLFPYNSMTTPYLGDQVWVLGYPGHIQTEFQSHFLYSISTFKPGYVVWKPSANMDNPDLNHITLLESNATYGNSGGPVFSTDDHQQLVGILVGGYEETESVYIGNKQAVDSITRQPFVAKSRSGVSIIESAEYVKKLIDYVQHQINAK